MTPLTFDDLLPLDEYAVRRGEFFAAHRRYLDRYRRVRVGPDVSLLFENRQTLWYKLQEILRVARLSDRERVGQELQWYNSVLPSRGHLRASLVIDVEDGRIGQTLKQWSDFRGEDACLLAARERIQASLITSRSEDLSVGSAHLIDFAITPEIRSALADSSAHVACEITHGSYQHRVMLSGVVRQSLVDDLSTSERGAA